MGLERCRAVFVAFSSLAVLPGCSSDDDGETDPTQQNQPACPAALEEAAFLRTDAPSAELFVDGTTAYVSDSFGLRVVDISDPEAPAEVTYFEQMVPPLYFNDLTVKDGVAYVASGIQGVITIDVSDSASPSFIAKVDGVPDNMHDSVAVALAGDIAFSAENVHGLRVYDFSAPGAPLELAAPAFHTTAHTDVAAVGDLAVVNDSSEIHLVDISNPGAPVVSATFPADNTKGLWLSGNLLYLGSGKMLIVLDVSDPSAPEELGSVELEDAVEDLFLDGACLYVGHADSGITAVDVQRPETPLANERTRPFGILAVNGVHAANGLVYAVSHNQGLRVFRPGEPEEMP